MKEEADKSRIEKDLQTLTERLELIEGN